MTTTLRQIEKERICGRVGDLPAGMVGIKIDAYTVYPKIRELLFTNPSGKPFGGNLYPGIWLDPIGWGMPMIVGFEQDSERETFCSLLDEAGLAWKQV